MNSADDNCILDSLISGEWGACIIGWSGSVRSAALSKLVDALSAHCVVIVRLNSTARPRHVQALLAQAAKARQATDASTRSVVVVDNAEQLRDDTLSVLNEVAGMLVEGKHLTRLLLVGTPDLMTRLFVKGAWMLQAHLAYRLDTFEPKPLSEVNDPESPKVVGRVAGLVFGITALAAAVTAFEIPRAWESLFSGGKVQAKAPTMLAASAVPVGEHAGWGAPLLPQRSETKALPILLSSALFADHQSPQIASLEAAAEQLIATVPGAAPSISVVPSPVSEPQSSAAPQDVLSLADALPSLPQAQIADQAPPIVAS